MSASKQVLVAMAMVVALAIALGLLFQHASLVGGILGQLKPSGPAPLSAGAALGALSCGAGTYPTQVGCRPLDIPTTPPHAAALINELSIPGAAMAYYDISGTSYESIFNQVKALGPGPDNDPSAPPGTYAFASTQLEEVKFVGDCRVSAVAYLSFHQTILMPRLTPAPSGLSQQNIDAWNYQVEVAALHEGRHLFINASTVVDYQAKMRKTLGGCSAIDNLFQQMNQDLRDRNEAYHAELRANCKPELGCSPKWLGT